MSLKTRIAKLEKNNKSKKDPRLEVGFNLTPATMLALYKGELHVPNFERLPDSRQAEQEIKYYEDMIVKIIKGEL